MNKYYFKIIVHTFDHVDITTGEKNLTTKRSDEQCPKYPEFTIGSYQCSEKCKYRVDYSYVESWIICDPTSQLLREKKLKRIIDEESIL